MDNQVIYDLVKEVKEEQKELTVSLYEHSRSFNSHIVEDQKMADHISGLRIGLDKNNEILEKLTETVIIHEARSLNLEKVVVGDENHIGLAKRIETLEEPKKAKKYLYDKWMSIFKIIGAGGLAFGIISKYMGWI